MFSQAIIDSAKPAPMPVEAPVSDSKAAEGVGYASLPHPLEEGTVVRCVYVQSCWTRHVVNKDYVIDSTGSFTDERGTRTPTSWGRSDGVSRARFIIVEDKPKFKVGDKVRAKSDTPYGITTDGWEGIVTEVRSYTILVQGHGDHRKSVMDQGWLVEPEFFDLVEDEPKILTVDLESEPLFGFGEATPSKRDSSQFRWDELTDEEKAELLLAHHEGKRIQYKGVWDTSWTTTVSPEFCYNLNYRVFTPEMEEAERKEEARKKINDLRSQIADLEATIH